jgi:hypothetical protein
MKKHINTAEIMSELEGSVFFPSKPQAPIQQEQPPLKEKARKTANPQDGKTERPQTVLPANLQARLPAYPKEVKPTKPLAVKPANPLDRKPVSETVEKYTTRLVPSMVRRIKIYAAQQDMKDYEVVEKALIEYFEKNK